jgi:GTP-binding protein
MTNTVAIVGRPNVGKSTLYNRLVENNKSITDDACGTTRDRHYGYSEWNGVPFTVIDTGGYVTDDVDIFATEIRKHIKISLQQADLILFTVDCKDGVTGQDKEFANILRSIKKPIILVANKADNLKLSWISNEFYSLGFGDPFPISAANGSGTGDLLDEVVNKLDKDIALPNEDVPRVAILGRPNVGKSSFINALLGEERCVATEIAGTTRDSIDARYQLYGHNMILTDTAGIRKKNKPKENVEFYSVMRSISSMQRSDVCIVMIDALQGIEAQDVTLISLAYKYKKGIIILVNKWDLIEKSRKTYAEYREAVFNKIKPIADVPVIFVSAISKQRIFEAINTAASVYKTMHTRITTSKLNTVLLPLIEKYPPPAIKGKYVKIKYITQLPTNNIVIAFFCNLPQYIKPPYKGYLENQIRKNFDLTGVPISLVFRNK